MKCSKRDILPRIEIPGIPIPKIVPKPIIPVFPKPVAVGVPNVPGRMPDIAPEPVPVPKPADPKPAAPACKRADNACAPGNTYTFSGKDYVEKGRALRERVQGVLGKNEARDHNYQIEKPRYYIKIDTHAELQIDSRVEEFVKEQGIDVGKNFLSRPRVWTRYQVYGVGKATEVRDRSSVVDVYVSVKDKVMVPKRLFRNDDELYDKNLPLKDRLPMSEWLFQLWKRAVQDGEKDYKVKIDVGDLHKIIGIDVANADAKAILFKAQREVGHNAPTFTIKPQDEAAFDALSYSSSGISKMNMLYDHSGATELNNLKPVQIDVSTQETLPMIVWTYGRS